MAKLDLSQNRAIVGGNAIANRDDQEALIKNAKDGTPFTPSIAGKANYQSESALDAALKAKGGAYADQKYLDGLSTNDKVFALRQANGLIK